MKKRIAGILTAAAVSLSMIPAIPAFAETSVNIGDHVQMGTYYDMPIIWRCVAIDENGPLMLSDKIITTKAFDASGLTAAGSHPRYQARRASGSNYWGDSNIRTWLNSAEQSVTWPDKNPPYKSNVVDGYNAYDKEQGFLNAFSDTEMGVIKTVTQKAIVAIAEHEDGVYDIGTENFVWKAEIDDVVQNYDNAFAENVDDTVFLLDVKQVNAVYNNEDVLGKDYYIGEPTPQCVANGDYKNSIFAVGKKWSYWLRTPYTDVDANVTLDEGIVVRYVGSNGIVANNPANVGYIGIRPAFYLSDAADFPYGDGSKMSPYSFTEDDAIKVTLNGDRVLFDQPPVIVDERTLVPVRAIFESMGYTVDWNGETQTATAVKGDDFISVTIGSPEIVYTTNGESGIYTCDVPAQIISERTLVPVRAISESAGCNVDWNDETKTVIITK